MFGATVTATKHIRKDLKSAFPGVKFSVRKNTSSWYDGVDIAYSDPAVPAMYVRRIAEKYQGYRFNGQTDNYDPQEPVMIDGEPVSFPIAFIGVTNRADY